MPTYSELANLGSWLSEMTLKGRPNFERAVREARWGDAPAFAVGSVATLPAARALGYAFEDLLDRPLIVREAGRFLAASPGMLRAGSVVALVADGSPELTEAAAAARRRGARVLVLGNSPEALTAAAQDVITLPGADGPAASGLAAACVRHAAACYLALVAARLLKRPESRLERVQRDWNELPGHLDRAIGQFADAVRSLAADLRPTHPQFFVGGGLCEASAEQAAAFARQAGSRTVVGVDPAGMRSGWLATVGPETGAVFLSGSRNRFKKAATQLAREVRASGAMILALTDNNDRDLVSEARHTLLLPDLAELPASVLALALGGWLAGEAASPLAAKRPAGRLEASRHETGNAAAPE